MPFADSKNFDDCVKKRMAESNYSEETAKKVCGKMKVELEKAGEPAVKEWNFNPDEILASPRKVRGIFHQPVVDKDGELINSKGMRDAVPDFMHLPALHDFHKERPVGLATKVQELGGGRFYMEGVIKATHDCDDVWEKVKTGNYGQMSIFGKRTKYNNQCALPQSMRNGPCITDGVRLDSISICDENARNPQTSLEMMKAKIVFDAEELRKAETAGESPLMHQTTDYAGGKVRIKKCPRCQNKPEENPVTTISKEEKVKKADEPEAPEEHPTVREKGSKSNVKSENKNPFRETGAAHPKRTQAGYPIPSGQNVPPKRGNVESRKEKEPDPSSHRETERRVTGAHAVAHYQTEAIKEKMAKKVAPGGTKKEKRHYKIGAPIKPRAHKPGRGEEHMTSPYQKEEHGSAAAKEQATSASERHKEQQTRFDKADTMDDEMGKAGKRPVITEEPAKTGGTSQSTRKNVSKETVRGKSQGEDYHGGRLEKADEEMEKSAAEDLEEEEYEEEDDKDFKHLSPKDKEGNWNKSENPNGTPGLKKAKADKGPDEEDKENEEDQEEEYEEEEKEVEKSAYVGKTSHEGKGRETKKKRIAGKDAKRLGYDTAKEEEGAEALGRMQKAKGDEDASSELFDPSTVTKGEPMVNDETEQDVEYVTKALVPIEEIDTIVKARTEEISKAYMGRLDEIVKAYDEKVGTLTARIEKMENETIRKGGSIVVIPELLNADGTGAMSNADAVAKMQAGK